MAPKKEVETFTATRITVHSKLPFDTVARNLETSIGSAGDVQPWRAMIGTMSSFTPERQQFFTAATEKHIGMHGFMFFQEYNHGTWVPIFGVGDGLKSKRVILGNPLIAITMLKHDMTAGLAVPVELLLQEKKEGGTDLVYQLPSALITGLNRDEELVKAAEVLDKKLEKLVDWIATFND